MIGERSVTMWSGAWIAAMVSMAIGPAGGCARGGSSGMPVTEYGYAFAVETDRQGRGGVMLGEWLPGVATRVIVLVQRGYGAGVGAGLAARGSEGTIVVTGAGEHDGGNGGLGDGAGAGALDGGGLGDTGPRGTSRACGGAGTDSGATRGRGGRGARGHRGAGTSHAGTRAGSPLGGERASWSQPESAELSRNGGRTPQPGGVEGGSAGGHGEPGDQGLSIGIALWGVISVPASIAPLLETTSLLLDAGVSPTAVARKWLQRALRVTGDRLRREIASHAAELAARRGQAVRAELSRLDDYARLPAAEQSRIIDAMTDAFQREYFEKLERSAADEMARLERALADHAASPPRPGSAEAYVERLMREDLGAAERVQLAARQARADFRPKVKPPAARGAWSPGQAALSKVPSRWGRAAPTKKGVGVRWTDPANKGNGIRIDAGNPANSQATQQVDHVIVRHNGRVIGRSGRPISGSIADNAAEAHIPLSEWLTWSSWFSP